MMEKEYKISWLKVTGVLLIIIVIGVLVYLAFFKKEDGYDLANQVYIENMEALKNAGFEYFYNDNLPTKIGESREISLKNMLFNKLLVELKDEKGQACDSNRSYVRATKSLDNEYDIKVNLVCENKNDYILTTLVDESNIIDDNKSDIVDNSGVNNNVKPNQNNSNKKPVVQQVYKYNINYVYTCKNDCKDNVYYSVYFVSNGGNSIAKQTIKYGDKALYVTSTRDGYVFEGWYIDSNLMQKYDFNSPVTNTLTLYAKWEKNENNTYYHVSFNSDGGTGVSVQRVLAGNKAFEPSNPTKSGYEFKGWYYNNQEFNFSTPIYQDYVLVAKWQKINPTYSMYCKITNDTYYSISYVGADQKTKEYKWTIKFDNLKAKGLKVEKIGYLNTLTDYNDAYVKYTFYRGISMVGGNDKYSIPITSGDMLRDYSLKQSNFEKNITTPYYKDGYWYVDVTVKINNYNNVTSYYASKISSDIYFVPFYFKVSYTDLANCVIDLDDNWFNYAGYEILPTNYKQ